MWPLALNIFKKLPWGKIILYLAVGAIAVGVLLYIRGAENNRSKVKTQSAQIKQIAQINSDNLQAHREQINLLSESFKNDLEREKTYAEKIQIINKGPGGNCARNSPAIVNSIRLRREARQRHKNGKN